VRLSERHPQNQEKIGNLWLQINTCVSTTTRKVTNSPQDANEVRRQIDAWLDQYDGEFTHFVTLTLDAKRIDAYINGSHNKRDRHDPDLVKLYQRSMRHFLSRLQKTLYGNLARHDRSPLLFVPIIEGLKHGEVPHFHCFAHVTSDRHERLEQIIKDCWMKVQFAGRQIDVQNYRDRGALRYGAKNALSLHRESVDWLNVQMPKRSHSPAE
jgi:hypothetical protein